MKSSDRTAAQRAEADATLAAVDRALESGRPSGQGDARERELESLALTLQAGVPEASPSFAADLERRVQDGFAQESVRARPVRRNAPPRPGAIRITDRRALGVLAASLAALVVGVGTLATVGGPTGGGGGSGLVAPTDGGGSSASGGGSAMPMLAPEDGGTSTEQFSDESSSGPSARSADAPVQSTTPPLSGTDGFAPGERERRIERGASLTLSAPDDEIDRVAEDVVVTVDRHRGYLVTSSTFSGEDRSGGGTFDLRVPVDELRGTLSDLSVLGRVEAQSQSGNDLTEPVATAEDRLDGARGEQRSVLRRLEAADTDREARALRERLNLVSAEVRGLRDQLAALEERTDYAKVSVTLTDESGAGAPADPDSTAAALDDAVDSLVAAFNLALRAIGVLLPLAVLAGLVWLAARTIRRRRREAVLG